MITIGIIGNGFVGQATQIFSRSPNVECLVYDIEPDKCIPTDCTCEMIANECDLIFICVPTPMNAYTGACHTNIISGCIEDLCSIDPDVRGKIIVRSTVPPGTCAQFKVAHMPEYLTEANWEQDFINTTEWHLGVVSLKDLSLVDSLTKLLADCVRNQVIRNDALFYRTTKVTEATKYFRNAMLSVRIAFCNELAQYCKAIDVNYNTVRELMISDERIGSSHTAVPGPDGKHGFGGTCLPKDLSGLAEAMKQAGVKPLILEAAKIRNETIDRPDKEWLQKVGRAVNYLI